MALTRRSFFDPIRSFFADKRVNEGSNPPVYVANEWPIYDAFGWTIDAVQAVLQQLSVGYLTGPESLMLAMTRDPVYAHGMKTRCQEMARIEHQLEPADGLPRRQFRELEAHLPSLWEGGSGPNALSLITKYRCSLGVAPAAVSWALSSSGRTWLPTIHARQAGWMSYQPQAELYQFSAREDLFSVIPDGKEWLLFCEASSKYPHNEGNVRCLAVLWWMKHAVIRFWSQYNRAHGNPQKKIKGPAVQRELQQPNDMRGDGRAGGTRGGRGDVQNLVETAKTMAGGDVVFLPQYGDKQPSFDFELVEATASTWETFPAFLSYVDKWITLLWLGAWDNTQGDAAGSRARAEVHERVSLRYLSADCAATAAPLNSWLWPQWCEYNKIPREMAPTSRFLWEPPSDEMVEAEIRKTNADALAQATAAAEVIERHGTRVDWRALADAHKIPTLSGTPDMVPIPPVDRTQTKA